MSNQQPPKKKVVVKKKKVANKTTVSKNTGSKKQGSTKSKAPVRSKSKNKKASAANAYRTELIIGKSQLIIMIAGLVLVFIGLALMTGGAMDDPNVWDAGKIYSPRRLTLAPMLILLGMGLEIYAIFKKDKSA